MHINNFDKVDRKLRIGLDCWFMNLSGLLEYHDILQLALAYTNFDFIYNKDTFTKFNLYKEPAEYMSKENELIVAEDVKSIYVTDYYQNIFDTCDLIFKFDLKKIPSHNPHDLQQIKKEYLDKNIPVQISFDHYYAIDVYRQLFPEMMHFHSKYHKILLVDIDYDSNSASIIDKFYRFAGKVSIDQLTQCVNSEHIGSDGFFIVKNVGQNTKCGRPIDLLLQNISITLKKENNLNGRNYLKNVDAIKAFQSDLKVILSDLYSTKGRYASQFFTQIVKPTILQKLSFYNLLTYLSQNDPEVRVHVEGILELLNLSYKKWAIIDNLCDKSFLAGKPILEYESNFSNVVADVIENDSRVYEAFDGMLNLFSKE